MNIFTRKSITGRDLIKIDFAPFYSSHFCNMDGNTDLLRKFLQTLFFD